MSYDPLGPDGAGFHAGTTTQTSTAVSPSKGPHPNDDPGPVQQEPGTYYPSGDTGGSSFNGVDPSTVSFWVAPNADGFVVADGYGRQTFADTTEIEVVAHRQQQIIADLLPSNNPGIQAQANTAGAASVSNPTIEVQAPRYDPCDPSLANQISALGSHLGSFNLDQDTLGELTAVPYLLDPNNVQAIPHLNLQSKMIDSGANGAVYVWQHDVSGAYIVDTEGSNSLDIKMEAVVRSMPLISLGAEAADYSDMIKNYSQSLFSTIHANDPTQQVYIIGHSYGGGNAVMESAIAVEAGIPASQIHVLAIAPVAAEGILRDEGISGSDVPLGSVTSIVNEWDEFRFLMSDQYFGNLIIHDETASTVHASDGTPLFSLADHSLCQYVRNIPGPT